MCSERWRMGKKKVRMVSECLSRTAIPKNSNQASFQDGITLIRT
jgi:hypothetical protein